MYFAYNFILIDELDIEIIRIVGETFIFLVISLILDYQLYSNLRSRKKIFEPNQDAKKN